MRHRHDNFLSVLLALLFAVSSWMPLSARAEAQMRCVGASPQAAPCVRAEVSAGLTDQQVYGVLMSCCRSMQSGCAMPRSSSVQTHSAQTHSAQAHPAGMPHRDVFARAAAPSTHRCLVSVRACAPVPVTLAAPRLRWLLTASPALAPPAATFAVIGLRAAAPASWPYTLPLSPHAAPAQHGLRAPPAA